MLIGSLAQNTGVWWLSRVVRPRKPHIINRRHATLRGNDLTATWPFHQMLVLNGESFGSVKRYPAGGGMLQVFLFSSLVQVVVLRLRIETTRFSLLHLGFGH